MDRSVPPENRAKRFTGENPGHNRGPVIASRRALDPAPAVFRGIAGRQYQPGPCAPDHLACLFEPGHCLTGATGDPEKIKATPF
jgi:hypothetical protein